MWGPIGAALGTCIALVICNIILINIYYSKVIKLKIMRFWKEIFKQAIPFAIPICIMILIKEKTCIVGFKGFIIYSGIYVCLYCITTYFLSMNEYEKKLIKTFIRKIKKTKKERI